MPPSVERSLRATRAVRYTESDEDSPVQSSFQTPQPKPYIDLVGEDEDDDEDFEILREERKTSGGRSLRNRSMLAPSSKAVENGDRKSGKSHKSHHKSSARISDILGPDHLSLTPVVSTRNAIRHEIATNTLAKRDRFFVDKKDFFLPLLPSGHNHVKKLVEKQNALSAEEKAKTPGTHPYEEIEQQPRGITATMKPYQLSGLSFMLYLHRNGLSGILGDEMGLGKTLQTLSLFQYLKENEPKVSGGQTRPFLVICPLSVLSSWMAEARKWAPGLKVLRFHGESQPDMR